jgi:hypothetical protein
VFSLCAVSCVGTGARLDVAPRPVDRQEKAASSHISVISVARWEEYAEALQPTYILKPEEALAQAVPATMRLEEKLVDAMLARLKLAPPTSGTTSTATNAIETRNQTAAEVTSITQSSSQTAQSTETKAPGDVSTLANQAFTPPKPGELGPEKSILDGTVSLDPMTRYWAATALYQEVQALNRYIKDAAARRDSLPYVVRLQISLLPVLRGQAYDASTTFAFFTGDGRPQSLLHIVSAPTASPRAGWAGSTEGPSVEDPPSPQTQAQAQDKPPPVKAVAEPSQQTAKTEVPCGLALPAPTIVPLLVTDNLENAMHSRSLATVRDFGLALSMLTGGFGAGVDFQKQRNQVDALVGNDLNSLLTVGRVADNALRVRLGAMQQASSRYAMVPRTHTVTVLVLVPAAVFTECPRTPGLRLVSRTDITDSVRGIVLPDRTDTERDALLATIQTKYGLGDLDMAKLLGMAQTGNQKEFFTMVREKTPFSESVWLDLISSMVGSRYAPAAIELPNPFSPDVSENQIAAALDDTKTATVITLSDGKNLLASQILGTLEVGTGTSMIPVPAQKVEAFGNGRQLRLMFPSLRAMNLTEDGKPVPPLKLTLTREPALWENATPWRRELFNIRYHIVPPPKDEKKDKPGDWTVSSAVIVADKGVGTIQIAFKINDGAKKLTLSVEKADLTAATSDPVGVLVRLDGRWTLAKSGSADLALRNLTPGNDVLISLMDDKTVVQQARLEVQAAK